MTSYDVSMMALNDSIFGHFMGGGGLLNSITA